MNDHAVQVALREIGKRVVGLAVEGVRETVEGVREKRGAMIRQYLTSGISTLMDYKLRELQNLNSPTHE